MMLILTIMLSLSSLFLIHCDDFKLIYTDMSEPMKDYAIAEAMLLFVDPVDNIQDVLADKMDTKYGSTWFTVAGQSETKIHSKFQTNTTLIVEYKNNRIILGKIKESKQSNISKVI